jgi:hypothetical protein
MAVGKRQRPHPYRGAAFVVEGRVLGWLAVEEAVSCCDGCGENREEVLSGWRRAGFDKTFERNSTEVEGHARDSVENAVGVGWQ